MDIPSRRCKIKALFHSVSHTGKFSVELLISHYHCLIMHILLTLSSAFIPPKVFYPEDPSSSTSEILAETLLFHTSNPRHHPT
jgi:hypothetical protein